MTEKLDSNWRPLGSVTARVVSELEKKNMRTWEPAPPYPGIRPGGIADRALRNITPDKKKDS